MKKPHFVSKMRFFKAFSGFYGGDKRDRTADLLNAMAHVTQKTIDKLSIFLKAGNTGTIVRKYWTKIQ